MSSSKESSSPTNSPLPAIAWVPVFDVSSIRPILLCTSLIAKGQDKGFVTTGEHLHCPFRCKPEFEFIGALITHLERHHAGERDEEAEKL